MGNFGCRFVEQELRAGAGVSFEQGSFGLVALALDGEVPSRDRVLRGDRSERENVAEIRCLRVRSREVAGVAVGVE